MGMPTQEELDDEEYHRIAPMAIDSQKQVDEYTNPEMQSRTYIASGRKEFNRFQFAHHALKGTDMGMVKSWRAVAAYGDLEKKTRDELLARVKEQEATEVA